MGGRVALRVEAHRDQPCLAREARLGGERAVDALEHRIAERAAGDVDAGRVDEGHDGHLAALEREERRRAGGVDERVVAHGLDDRERVGAGCGRGVLRGEGSDGIGIAEGGRVDTAQVRSGHVRRDHRPGERHERRERRADHDPSKIWFL